MQKKLGFISYVVCMSWSDTIWSVCPQVICGFHLVCSCRLSVSSSSGEEEAFDADAVVFAVGVKAMQGIVSSSPDLAACPVGIPLLLFSLH